MAKLKESARRALDDRAGDGFRGKGDLLADEYYVDPAQMLEELKSVYPKQFANVELPPPPKSTTRATRKRGRQAGRTGAPVPLARSADDPRLAEQGLGDGRSPSRSTSRRRCWWACCWPARGSSTRSGTSWRPGCIRTSGSTCNAICRSASGLFLVGAALAFFVVFEPVLDFLLSFNRSMGIGPEPRINEWLSFVLILPVGFGIGFQLPLVMLFLERIGVFTVKSYLSQWRIAVLVIFVVAAILMPPDPYSMMLMAGSLTFLYFGGILLCKLLPRRVEPVSAVAGRLCFRE